MPATDLPILYSFRRCPYAMRARLSLAVSEVSCQLREVVLRNKPPALLAASPKGTVPVLVINDGEVLEQSLDIMLWALARNDPQQWLTPPGTSLADMLALVAQCDGYFKHHLDRYKYPQRYVRAEEAANDGDAPDGDPELQGCASNGPMDGGGASLAPDRLAHESRAHAAQWLLILEQRLALGGYLFGGRSSVADMAILPFVRQFAHVDRAWFGAQPWPCLSNWLDQWRESALFERVMHKYAPWNEGAEAVLFPPPPTVLPTCHA